jgi:1,4-dihydroxy-2-naphthoyl-CoA hydrolase
MSIWRNVFSLEYLNGNPGTLNSSLGILFTEVGDDFVRGTMPVDERTMQPYGLLHGGASVALAETLGSMGAAMCVDANEYQVVGQEINANHVRQCGPKAGLHFAIDHGRHQARRPGTVRSVLAFAT